MTKNLDGSLAHNVFRKKTHIEQYIHANSHHHLTQKLGVFNNLITKVLGSWTVNIYKRRNSIFLKFPRIMVTKIIKL